MKFPSPSSSPTSPPSPLPVSVGPGWEKYSFSSSPSPPFSPPSSSSNSSPLLLRKSPARPREPSFFQLDRVRIDNTQPKSCLKKILEWLFLRCCCRRQNLITSVFNPQKTLNLHTQPTARPTSPDRLLPNQGT